MSRKYHSLLVRERGLKKWSPEFGDYDLDVVKQEMADQKYADYARIFEFKIITTADGHSDIMAKVEKLSQE